MVRNSRKSQRVRSHSRRESRRTDRTEPYHSIDIVEESEFDLGEWDEEDPYVNIPMQNGYMRTDHAYEQEISLEQEKLHRRAEYESQLWEDYPSDIDPEGDVAALDDFTLSPEYGNRQPRNSRGSKGRKGERKQSVQLSPKSSQRTGLWKLFAVVSVIILAMISVVIIYFSPWFTLQIIEIQGAHMVSRSQMIAQLGVRMRTPLVEINDLTVAKNVSANFAPIRKTIVHKKFPHTLVIQVVERTPVAVTRNNQIIDGQGVIFGYRPVPQTPHTPGIITAKNPLDSLPLLNTDAPSPVDGPTRDALQVYMALPNDIKRQVREIDAKSISTIDFILDDKKQVIYGTNSDIAAKNDALEALLTRPGVIYDVSSSNLPVIRR